MTSKAPSKGKDLAAFKSAHDKRTIVPDKFRAALTELGDSWEYEGDFIRRCKLSTGDFANYREQFRDFCVETPRRAGQSHAKRVWAGTVAFAKKLREQIG